MAAKPTFVLVPGSFHPAETYDHLVPLLQAAGYSTQSTSLPSALSDPDAGLQTDVVHLRDTLLCPLVEEGKQIVLVLHSYAGFPGALAIEGLGQRERASQGLGGGVLGVVFVAALVPVEGMSLVDAVGGALPPWMEINAEAGLMSVPDPLPWFYQDCDEDVAKALGSKLGRHSIKSFQGKSGPVACAGLAYDGRRGYIKAIQDRAIPVPGQEATVQGSGMEIVVKEIDSSHSPFLSKPGETARLLEEFAIMFAADA